MTPAVEQMVQDLVRAEFPDADIQEVAFEEATDADGDPILKVTVVFATAREIDTRKASGLVRHVWPRLRAVDEARFPLFRLMSSADAKRLKTAAA